MESHTLNIPNAHTETSQVIAIEKLIDWFLYKYKTLKSKEFINSL